MSSLSMFSMDGDHPSYKWLACLYVSEQNGVYFKNVF